MYILRNGIYVGGIERIFVNSGGTVPECYAVGERPRRAVVQRKIYFDILQRVLYLVPYFRLIARKSALNVQFASGNTTLTSNVSEKVSSPYAYRTTIVAAPTSDTSPSSV